MNLIDRLRFNASQLGRRSASPPLHIDAHERTPFLSWQARKNADLSIHIGTIFLICGIVTIILQLFTPNEVPTSLFVGLSIGFLAGVMLIRTPTLPQVASHAGELMVFVLAEVWFAIAVAYNTEGNNEIIPLMIALVVIVFFRLQGLLSSIMTIAITWLIFMYFYYVDGGKTDQIFNSVLLGVIAVTAKARLYRGMLAEFRTEQLLKELSAKNAELERAAITDPLTQLFNRRHLYAIIERWNANVPPPTVSLILIDIDDFKELNDTHGHPEGDAALVHVAAAVRACASPSGACFRVGGEEFAILDQCSRDASLAVARQVLAKVQATTAVTVSIGCATVDLNGGIERLYKLADAALYRAKAQGKNRIEVA